jgi:hypothetical protein
VMVIVKKLMDMVGEKFVLLVGSKKTLNRLELWNPINRLFFFVKWKNYPKIACWLNLN